MKPCIVQKMPYIIRVCVIIIWSLCYVVNRVRVMTQISGCDVTCIVYMWPYILDVVSAIEAVMSYVR